MKLYIESYQSKIEELEKFEKQCEEMQEEVSNFRSIRQHLERELESSKNTHKEKKAEWKLKEQEFQNLINKGNAKQQVLEDKVKELETFLITNKNIQKGGKHQRGDLILFKDESQKINKNNKLKYLLKAIPSGSTKTSNNEFHDQLMSFSDLSTKMPEKSKPGSMKKTNPYKIEYFKNPKDACELT